MLENTKTFSSFSVNDLEKAKTFYEKSLGLKVSQSNGMLELESKDGSKTMIYPKPNHEPATFTVLNFAVPDVNKAVDDLVSAGVKFEHYDSEHMKTNAKGIVEEDGSPKIAWFKDPAGNILSVLQEN